MRRGEKAQGKWASARGEQRAGGRAWRERGSKHAARAAPHSEGSTPGNNSGQSRTTRREARATQEGRPCVAGAAHLGQSPILQSPSPSSISSPINDLVHWQPASKPASELRQRHASRHGQVAEPTSSSTFTTTGGQDPNASVAQAKPSSQPSRPRAPSPAHARPRPTSRRHPCSQLGRCWVLRRPNWPRYLHWPGR